ncbi:MAG: hypothetical protein Q7P63_02445 [Verrucomicrobiota bacterium JB022]|nr:hypothetical protein [Verrucomicrobiota bacterium JB022]
MFVEDSPDQPPRLLVDASSHRVQVGVLNANGTWRAFQSAEGDALETIFALSRQVLDESSLTLGDVQGFVHCQGPGSVLGLRLAAMAIEGWRAAASVAPLSLHGYYSLAMAAALHHARTREQAFTVISFFRRGQYNTLRVDCGELGPLELSDLDELRLESEAAPLLHLPQRRVRHELPENTRELDYDLRDLPKALALYHDLVEPLERAGAYMPQEPEFARWSAERHR